MPIYDVFGYDERRPTERRITQTLAPDRSTALEFTRSVWNAPALLETGIKPVTFTRVELAEGESEKPYQMSMFESESGNPDLSSVSGNRP